MALHEPREGWVSHIVTSRTAAETSPQTDRLERDVLCNQCRSRGGLALPRAVAGRAEAIIAWRATDSRSAMGTRTAYRTPYWRRKLEN